MNKTLKKEYKIGNKEIQYYYQFIFNGGKIEDINKAQSFISKLPILNKKTIKIRNRKGQMIAVIGKKGSVKRFSTDYFGKCWFFDGNKLGKKKRLQVESYFNEELLNKINTEGIEKVWKKISKRAEW